MTERQGFALYFPAWAAAKQANWRTDRGIAVAAVGRNESRHVRAVEAAGSAIARRQMRGVKIEDMRHACHFVALGRDKSSKDLTNAELDKVLALMRLLADADDLSAQVALDNPDLDARRRYEWAVRHCGHPEAYIGQISASKFGIRNWLALDNDQLRELSLTLKNRRPVQSMGPVRVQEVQKTMDEPF